MPSPPSPLSLAERLRARALALGFDLVGVARAEPLPGELARLEAFVAAGYHGELAWLAREPEVRCDPTHASVLAGARSVVVCALSYHREGDERSVADGGSAWPEGALVARYARGRDYHNFLRKKLRKLASWLRAEVPGAEAKPCVDTSPLLERAWAQRAGVGFVGKNGLVLAPGLGSYLLLGALVTSLELAPDEPASTRCGACTRCLDACPTRAFAAPFVLDARRCVSYLTIEAAGLADDDALLRGTGSWLFGCDVCQEVCPYNRTEPPPAHRTLEFAPAPARAGLTVRGVLALDEAGFARLTEGSPLARPGRAGLARNAAVALGNAGDPCDPALRDELTRAAREDPSPVVRDAARWALGRLDERRSGG